MEENIIRIPIREFLYRMRVDLKNQGTNERFLCNSGDRTVRDLIAVQEETFMSSMTSIHEFQTIFSDVVPEFNKHYLNGDPFLKGSAWWTMGNPVRLEALDLLCEKYKDSNKVLKIIYKTDIERFYFTYRLELE